MTFSELYFLSLEANNSGFNGRSIANMSFALPSLILHWIIDLDIIQTIDCECFSELALERVLAKFAKKTRVATHREGAHGFFLSYLLLNVVNGDPIPTLKEANFEMAPDARMRRIFEAGSLLYHQGRRTQFFVRTLSLEFGRRTISLQFGQSLRFGLQRANLSCLMRFVRGRATLRGDRLKHVRVTRNPPPMKAKQI